MKTTSRFLLLAFLSLSLVACGGGGEEGGVDPALQEAALEALDTCGADRVEQFVELLELFAGAFIPGGSADDFLIEGPLASGVGWSADLDNDLNPDLRGTLEFLDANGDPLDLDENPDALPFDLAELLPPGGLGNLIQYLPQLDPGTQIRFVFNSEGTADISNGVIVFQITNGTIQGNVSVGAASCAATFDFGSITFDLLGGGYPVGTIDFDLDSDSDLFEGEVRMNGTVTATIVITDSGDNTFRFSLNLDTFQVSEST